MKFGKFLFCIILTLSLSALDLSLYNSYVEVSASTILENNLANLESNTNNYINLSDEDYVEVFKENNQMLYLTQSDIYLMSQLKVLYINLELFLALLMVKLTLNQLKNVLMLFMMH